ncbi:hypothetical protein [Paramagnetospirillum magneticum]|uniref:Uncharacterized protein n=1 Tax=Paramagnetospirillum magneticum (strain ATCC 700264 / AMB-1) TaxID=342108 RepID=Q2W310_PARM1|nr:hypothetical protein [Paramagnetospirillum magneticum]BAE51765.1 hypothetical protein amb2961 [Paramagnetospirillum magneticum AMB-1]
MIRQAFFVALIALSVLPLRTANADQPAPASKVGGGPAHFIVLIDDSGDMKRFRPRVRRFLPQVLFGSSGLNGLPAFRPGIDTVSLGYYGISARSHADSATAPRHPCTDRPANSLLPNDMIDWVDRGERIADLAAFSALLDETVSAECRMHHGWSPISIAETVALAGANGRLPAEARVSRVVLVNVTNDAFNVEGQEISAFSRRLSVTGVSEAQEISRQMSDLFQRLSPAPWDVQVSLRGDLYQGVERLHKSDDPLTIRLTELRPALDDLAARVVAPSELRLKRWAVAPDAIALRADGDNALTIRGSERLLPYSLAWARRDSGTPWPVGAASVNLSGSRSLAECLAPCRRDAAGLSMPLLPVLGIPEQVAPGQSPTTGATLALSVTYDFRTAGLYDHFRVSSPPRSVTLTPPSPPVLPEGHGAGAFLAPGLFAAAPLDDQLLVAQWQPSDDRAPGLDEEEAVNRLLAARDRRQITAQAGLVVISLILLGAILATLYRRYYHRPFAPHLVWKGIDGITVDFNTERSGPILVGSALLHNAVEVPFFGRWLRNTAQPRRMAAITLAVEDPAGLGILTHGKDLLGFARIEDTGHTLVAEMDQNVSDGTNFDVFLDPRQIIDLRHPGDGGAVSLPLSITVTMAWAGGKTVGTAAIVPLGAIPEDQHPPKVRFIPAPDRVEFGQKPDGSPLTRTLGVFELVNVTRHATFARSYRGRYELKALHRNHALSEGAIRLGATHVDIPPGRSQSLSLDLICDGVRIKNPEQEFESFTFQLMGEMAPGSDGDRHEFHLYRDSTRPELDIGLSDDDRHWHIGFSPDGSPHRIEAAAAGHGVPEPIIDGKVVLAQQSVVYYPDSGPKELLTLEFRNVARNGQGYVQIHLEPRLIVQPDVANSFELHPGLAFDDLLQVRDGSPVSIPSTFEVAADGSVVVRHISLDSTRIKTIHCGILPLGAVQLDLTVRNTVLDRHHHPLGGGRSLSFQVPLSLTQMPDPNWLCIDFGTSAIAAALGEGSTVTPLDLQNATETLSLPDGPVHISLASEDVRNLERGGPFLPSFVLCDADLRRHLVADPGSTRRAGFPRYPQPSLRPGDPAFLTVPAPADSIRSTPERVVYSLKSWLGVGADDVALGTEVEIDDEDGLRKVTRLPVDLTVKSAFSALYTAYLEPLKVRAGRIVVTHPNTFTAHHTQRLHSVVFSALSGRLGIPVPEWVRMVSESDAAAFHYCTTGRDSLTPSTGTETVLVYDFGAGTLDLSLVRITWDPTGTGVPVKWQILGRLGVPVAGNHLDSLLARLVDEALRDSTVLPEDRFSYQYPLVTTRFEESRKDHRSAVLNLWLAIREAKQADGGWDGIRPLVITLSRSMGQTGLGAAGGQDVIRPLQSGKVKSDEELPPEDQAAIFRRQNGETCLSLPAQRIFDFAPLKAFMDFVTRDVVAECLGAAKCKSDQVDTIVVTGRGALWPGLRQAVWDQFGPKTARTDLAGAKAMKEVVVRGAIAWQALGNQVEFVDTPPPRLAAQFEEGRIVPEEEWEAGPLKFGRSAWFKLVQVAHRKPSPKDFKTLRQHYYVDLHPVRYRRDTYFGDGLVKLERVNTSYGPEIRIADGNGRIAARVTYETSAGMDAIHAPWPIGTTLLTPEE